jgi:hypothetical protein
MGQDYTRSSGQESAYEPGGYDLFSKDVVRVGVDLQLNIPGGELASQDLLLLDAGYATEGFGGTANLDYMFNHLVGMGASVGLGVLPFQTQPWESIYSLDSTFIDITAENWSYWNFAFHLEFDYKVEQADFYAKLQVGRLGLNPPKVETNYNDRGFEYSIIDEGEMGVSYSLGATLGARLYFGDLYLNLTNSVTIANPNIEIRRSNSISGLSYSYDYDQEVRLFRFGLGIGYRLQ